MTGWGTKIYNFQKCKLMKIFNTLEEYVFGCLLVGLHSKTSNLQLAIQI